jgi:hypothetical protein
MGWDEAALLCLWREKRGEAPPGSGKPIELPCEAKPTPVKVHANPKPASLAMF